MDVFECKCDSEYQDKIYGKNKRVFNTTGKGYRCTVCGTEKGQGGTEKKKSK